MSRNEVMSFSLTGDKSYEYRIPLGQGSFSIGTIGISEGKYDAWVEDNSPINWHTFTRDWPRIFYYSGNDQGFIEWSTRRVIEDFNWTPKVDCVVDFTNAKINRMLIHSKQVEINMTIGNKIRDFFFSGNLEKIHVEQCSSLPYLYFSSLCTQKENEFYQLPVFEALRDVTSVNINHSPLGQAFDCRSLLQFQKLTSLDLAGNMTHLEVLKDLKNLERIGLRYMPDLKNMPSLTSWGNLKNIIGYNIEENQGKILRKELNNLSKTKELEYSNVVQLRKAIWFTTEYGLPFSDWDKKKAKVATKAYKACLKEIKKAKTQKDVKSAIVLFIDVINQLDNIETSEREDVGTAIYQFIESSPLAISQEKAQMWFDDTRNF